MRTITTATDFRAALDEKLANQKYRRGLHRRLRAAGVPVKACGRCFQVKRLGEFNSAAKSPDGRQSYCLPCSHAAVKAADRVRRQDPAVLEAERAYGREYERRRREDPEYREARRAASADYRDACRAKWTAPDGSIIEGALSAPKRCTTKTNGGCERLLTRAEFYPQRDTTDGRTPRCRECHDRHNAARAERRRQGIVAILAEEQGGQCYICQRAFGPDLAFEVEHIMPRALDGSDDLENLALACFACNRGPGGKFDKDPWDYLPGALAEVGIDFHAAVRALMTYGEVVDGLDDQDDLTEAA